MNETTMKILSLFDGDELISRVNIAGKLRLEIDVVQDHLDWLHVSGYVEQESTFYRMTEQGQKWFTMEVERKS